MRYRKPEYDFHLCFLQLVNITNQQNKVWLVKLTKPTIIYAQKELLYSLQYAPIQHEKEEDLTIWHVHLNKFKIIECDAPVSINGQHNIDLFLVQQLFTGNAKTQSHRNKEEEKPRNYYNQKDKLGLTSARMSRNWLPFLHVQQKKFLAFFSYMGCICVYS